MKFLEKQFGDAQSQLRDIVSASVILSIALIRDFLSLIARQDNRALRNRCTHCRLMVLSLSRVSCKTLGFLLSQETRLSIIRHARAFVPYTLLASVLELN